jgi:hypothetical protein
MDAEEPSARALNYSVRTDRGGDESLVEVFNAVDVRADRCLGEVAALQLL